MHERPVQHVALVEQVPPVVAQGVAQCPAVQVSPEQQSEAELQLPPLTPHVLQNPESHVRPEQHGELPEQLSSNSWRGTRQVPPLHSSPLQHSAFAAQVPPTE